jgi:hypothetical protein
MKFLKAGLVVVVLVVGASAFFLERQSNAQLREEVALLRTEVQQLAKRRSEPQAGRAAADVALAQNVQSDNDRAEVAKLREELNALKSRASELTQAAQTVKTALAVAGKSPADAIPVKLIPVNEWKNAGKATPAATFETVLWAASGGDVDTIASAVEFTGTAREKAQALLDRLPAATRAQYGSPEKLVALMLAKDADKVSGLQVLGQKEISPDTMGMRVRFGNELGQAKESSLVMHRSNDGWKLLLTDDPVDKWAKQLAAGGK